MVKLMISLVLFLLAANGSTSFYYQSKDYDGLFYLNSPFLAIYTVSSSTPVTWTATNNNNNGGGDGSCTINALDANNINVEITCTSTIMVEFQVYGNNDPSSMEKFYIKFNDPNQSSGCYSWWFLVLDNSSNSNSNNLLTSTDSNHEYQARVWVTTGSDTTLPTLIENTLKPSIESQEISKSFYLLGESPILGFQSNLKLDVTSKTFNQIESFWEMKFKATTLFPSDIPVDVKDEMGRTLVNCEIRDTKTIITKQKLDWTSLLASTQPTFISNPTTQTFRLFQDKCQKSSLYFLSSSFDNNQGLGLIHNANNNNVFNFINLPSSIQDIKDFASPKSTVCFLTTTDLVCGNELKSITNPNIDVSTLNRLTSTDFCHYSAYYDSYPGNEYIVTWSDDSTSTTKSKLNLSKDVNNDSFDTIINIDLNADEYISDVLVRPDTNSLVILVTNNNGFRIVFYNVESGELTNGYSQISSTSFINKPRLKSVGEKGSVIYLYANVLMFSPNGGASFFEKTILSRNQVPSSIGLRTSEFISFLDTSVEGNLVFLTSNNRVFFGSSGISDVIELAVGLQPNDLSAVSFDSLGRVFVYQPDSSLLVSKRQVPVLNELSTPRPPATLEPLKCGYQNWIYNNTQKEYLLDIGDSIDFPVTVVSSSNTQKPKLSVSYTNSTVVILDRDIKTQKGNVLQMNLKKTITERIAGKTDITIQPHGSNLGCPQPTTFSFSLQVGCPPNRHIRFRHDDRVFGNRLGTIDECNQYSNFEISAQHSTTNAQQDVVVDCSSLEQIEFSFFNSLWRPQLDLYDGDTFLRQVDSDFILTEVNNRNTFKYNDTSLDQTFNRNNYLRLSWGLDGLYIFEAKVINEDYSLCDLKARVGVVVYGSPLNPLIQIAILVGLIAAVLGSLVVSFLIQSKRLKQKKID